MKKILGFLLFINCIYAQEQYPKDFISPLKIDLDLSGNFGELRSNHFHSGIDIKTQKKEGLEVVAVADGYVSRIKISTYGYGKAIYITHPNGYTTVYGHLQKASGAIEDYIKKHQYEKRSFEIELFPTAKELPVKQGDVIALSGNSGGSGGPHLHFEFRETPSEKIVNPLYFGFTKYIKDSHEPEVFGLMVYPMDSTVVNKSERPIKVSFNKQADGSYLASKVIANGPIGFAVNAADKCTNPYNRNGVYKINTYLNGVKYYSYEFDKFSFDESRYINNFIDYSSYQMQKQRFQKLFFNSDYPLSVLKANKNKGIINTQAGANYTYRIELFDFDGNKTILYIPIEYGVSDVVFKKEINTSPYFLKSKIENNYTKNNVSVYVPENAFYDDFQLNFDVRDEVLFLHDDATPVHKNITITFSNIEGLSEEQMSKTFIGYVDDAKVSYNKTYRKGNQFSTKTRRLGVYKLAQDSIPPRIYNVNFIEGKNLLNQKTLTVSISDNLSGIDSYNAYLNGEWILMEYDYKTKKLVHQLSDNKFKEGRNDFKLIVTDDLQNSTTFESYFYMNP